MNAAIYQPLSGYFSDLVSSKPLELNAKAQRR
jgi:hypothetical protein